MLTGGKTDDRDRPGSNLSNCGREPIHLPGSIQPHGVLLVLAVALAVATARGDVAPAEEGEDVDLTDGTDTRTLLLLVAVLAVNVFLIETLGWAITGAILFTGASWVLGSRHWVRDIALGVALSVGTFYAFYVGLGVPLPAGILNGVL